MLKKVMAWTLLGSAILASGLAIYWRGDQGRQLLIILVLSIQAAIFEGINMVFLSHAAAS